MFLENRTSHFIELRQDGKKGLSPFAHPATEGQGPLRVRQRPLHVHLNLNLDVQKTPGL